MAKYLPEIGKLMDKHLSLELTGNRRVEGTLRGYDMFMNIVLDEAMELPRGGGDQNSRPIGKVVIRGNSIIAMDSRDC
eukprot:CAMPEP_0184682166 /NCGR_PEP_ID=MMETSP0312-20130426/6071_1 /TAXON_ID=31354 /ORGANISM="Compsopogon coeruleus, Strain SAG 36.94" /LENGTH=77 /DNA_ID=CAMNT_0027133607 /DNA_START=48 /DNA_END=281 /DNA_ORIENTATION=-